MKQIKIKLFEFHFIMDAEMRQKLKNLDLYKKMGSFSQLIVKILSLLLPKIEREHFKNKQRLSKYKLVNADENIKRKNVHVYLPEYLYKQLKLIHQDLNFYSIGQIVRMFLQLFLDLKEKYGRRTIRKLKTILRKWKEKNKKRKYNAISIRQLFHFIYQKPQKRRLLTLYNNKFIPIGIYRF